MMTNEELSSKIINDIQYIKQNSELLQKKLEDVDHDRLLLTYILNEIKYVLNYIQSTDFSFVSNIIDETYLLDFEQQFSSYKISMENYINGFTRKRLEDFIDKNRKIYNNLKYLNKDVLLVNNNEIDKINQRLQNLENEPNEIINTLNKNLTDAENASNTAKNYIDKIETIYSNAQYFQEGLKAEFDNLKIKSNELLNHNISMVLSDQFQDKADLLKDEAEKKLGILSLKPWEFSGFYGAMAILLFVNFVSWTIYFSCELNIDFWQYMMLKLTINIPLIIYVAFTLNEYTKAKKLYEEFDYKRIMAITLVNNYKTLKDELGLAEDKAFELIKTPFERIFDNPVHSIYGDKSGDKNIGLDQLEKITSIIEKMKK